jgi:hypothetical protein
MVIVLSTQRKRTPKVMSLPPTSSNLMLHLLRAHLQVMLWKAADQHGQPNEAEDITKFSWEVKNGVVMPVISREDITPPQLIDVVQYGC